jgi:hypothetical protein
MRPVFTLVLIIMSADECCTYKPKWTHATSKIIALVQDHIQALLQAGDHSGMR